MNRLNEFRLKVTAIKGLWLVFALVFPGAPAGAEESKVKILEPRSVAAAMAANPVEDVIRRQMAAIKARNGELAFALTTADFHEKYDDGGNFLGDLRLEHRTLYNHESYRFIKRHNVPGGFIQTVEVRGRYDGEIPVTVIFRVEEQPDGSLLIDSFTVLDTEAQPL